MLEITLSDLDLLHTHVSDLYALSYLQNLLMYDKTNNVICDENLNCFRESSDLYILDKQSETLLKLKNLLEKDNFTTHNNAK